jgi:acyl-CoA synthetase (NDP forming)
VSVSEQTAAAANGLDSLFKPELIALVGLSRNEASLGRRVLKHLRAHNFGGEVAVIHPTADEIGGIPARRAIQELERVPDLAVICTGGDAALDVMSDVVDAGVRARAVLASSGEIVREPDRVREILARGGARLLGPNSPGFVSVAPPVAPHISHFLTQNESIFDAPIGMITQSGAVGGILANRLLEARVGFRWLVCTGNEYDLGLGEVLGFLAEQDLRAIGLFVESVRDLDHFRSGLDLAAERGIEVCAVKVGESDAGQRQALTHTGALTGMSALFEQELVSRGGWLCRDLDELAACLSLATLPPARSRAIAVAATSGGLAGLYGDIATARGLTVPPLEDLANPWDTDTVVIDDPAETADRWRAMLAAPEIGAGVLGFSAQPDAVVNANADALAAAGIDKPFILLGSAGMPAAALETLRGRAVAVSDTHAAFAALDWWTRGTPSVNAPRRAHGSEALEVDELSAKALLAELGIPTPWGALARTPEEAVAAAEPGRGPYVLKCLRPALAHKAAAGGVRLGLTGEAAELRAAWTEMSAAVGRATGTSMTEALVEQQVDPGLELLISVGHDADYGPYLTIGAGGSRVEAAPDVAHRLIPAGEDAVASAFSELRIAGALQQAAAARGEVGAVPPGLVTIALALARYAQDHPGVSVEVNPVVVPLSARPCFAVDCVLVAGD